MSAVDVTASIALVRKESNVTVLEVIDDDDDDVDEDVLVIFCNRNSIPFGKISPSTTYAIPSNNGMYKLELNKYADGTDDEDTDVDVDIIVIVESINTSL